MKEEKDFNAGFFIVSVRSGYAAPITSGGASRRGTAVTFGWRNSSKLLSSKRLKASPTSTRTEGMVIVPCSMKTAAGIVSGYTDNLLLRAADVTIKEKRPLVLAARETPMSEIHLRNLYELSRMSNVWIVPPMMTFYQKPESIDDMVTHLAAKLLSPFGVEVKEYRRWKGC